MCALWHMFQQRSPYFKSRLSCQQYLTDPSKWRSTFHSIQTNLDAFPEAMSAENTRSEPEQWEPARQSLTHLHYEGSLSTLVEKLIGHPWKHWMELGSYLAFFLLWPPKSSLNCLNCFTKPRLGTQIPCWTSRKSLTFQSKRTVGEFGGLSYSLVMGNH